MPDEVTFREDLGIIEVRAYGEITIEQLEQTQDTIMRMIREHKVNRILVDAREVEKMPEVGGLYFFAGDLPPGDRAALLVSKSTPDETAFLESVAQNRGIQLKLFDNRDDALRWLDR